MGRHPWERIGHPECLGWAGTGMGQTASPRSSLHSISFPCQVGRRQGVIQAPQAPSTLTCESARHLRRRGLDTLELEPLNALAATNSTTFGRAFLFHLRPYPLLKCRAGPGNGLDAPSPGTCSSQVQGGAALTATSYLLPAYHLTIAATTAIYFLPFFFSSLSVMCPGLAMLEYHLDPRFHPSRCS